MKIASVEFGSARELFGEGARDNFVVIVETPKGELFIHENGILTEDQARRLADRARAAGKVDPARGAYWRVRYGTDAYLEQAAEVAFVLGGGGRPEDLPDELRSLT